jgi:hypothetical protein
LEHNRAHLLLPFDLYCLAMHQTERAEVQSAPLCREWHRKRLSKRLLNAGTVETLEESFLQRLKAQCGAQFTQKMEGMCNDLNTARQKQQQFQLWQQRQVQLRPSLPCVQEGRQAGTPVVLGDVLFTLW